MVQHFELLKSLCCLKRHLLGLSCLISVSACDVSHNSQAPKVQGSDPIVADFPIAYVYRPLPTDEDGNNTALELLDPAAFHPGAKLIIKERATTAARERVLSDEIFVTEEGDAAPLYDIKDLSTSEDGSKLLFAVRAPEIEGADDDEQPTWNIWQYDFENDDLHRLIQSEIIAQGGNDVDPHYLPSGEIVFSSDRQIRTRAILIDELKPQYSGLDDKRQEEAFVLHIMDDDGSDIEQVSFNVSQDLQPTLLANGDLLFVRRDGIGNHNQVSLYSSKTDGSNLQPYYGFHSQETGSNESDATFVQPKLLPDGRILAILQPRDSTRLGGDIIAIDGNNFTDYNQPTSANSGSQESGHQSLSNNRVDTEGTLPSPGGSYNSAEPLYDGSDRLLVSWSPCRLIDDNGQVRPCNTEVEMAIPADPLYGLWIYDPASGTQLPIKIPDEGFMYTDAVVLAPRPLTPRWQPQEIDPDLVQAGVAVLHVRSVYDLDGIDTAPGGIDSVADPAQTPPSDRPVRFLRIVKNVPIPSDDVLDFDNSIFGRSSAQGMREILGYVPVEPDGSAKFTVPADVPFMLDLLDAHGQRLGGRHQNWLQLRPGEQRECKGCHTSNSTLPHGRLDAEAASVNPGAIGGIPFANSRLVDEFGTTQPAPEFGESMAEYYTRINGSRTPTMDLVFSDEWTNPANAAPGDEINLRYVDVTANANPRDTSCAPLDNQPSTWSAPTSCVESGSWNSLCRTSIDYLTNIAPLWQADRRTCDDVGNLTTDNTCTSCHTRTRDGMLQVPAGQLELTADVSQDRNDYITSYAELMFDDNAQELTEGSLVDILLENDTGEFETDDNGDLVLDEEGNPIPIIELTPVPVPASMSTNGARASARFFTPFQVGGSHEGLLSAAEQKLIAEWLDIGGQYYNNPFNAPAN